MWRSSHWVTPPAGQAALVTPHSSSRRPVTARTLSTSPFCFHRAIRSLTTSRESCSSSTSTHHFVPSHLLSSPLGPVPTSQLELSRLTLAFPSVPISTFRSYALNPPAPFQDSKLDIEAEISRSESEDDMCEFTVWRRSDASPAAFFLRRLLQCGLPRTRPTMRSTTT